MLHRAARNAYSWWWASHIRTKQSKWLDQNLSDMEEKVEYIIKIIEEDGDSFAQRAEMYYKKRPELLNFVEDSFRGYRALAERYDHISKELQSANRTIASVCPEKVQLAMDEEDDEISPTTTTTASSPFSDSKQPSKNSPAVPKLNIPKVTKIPQKSSKAPTRLMSKNGLLKMSGPTTTTDAKTTSGMSKAEALEEIDKLQKDILGLQTEKEFIKSSYENGVAKYWEIEEQITEMQGKVNSLQDEFGIGTFIEDDEARTLMAATALKSCQEALIRLEEKQKVSDEEARIECRRIQESYEKLKIFKENFANQTLELSESTEVKDLDQQIESTGEKERNDLELLREKIKEQLQVDSSGESLTMSELAEKIDELVEKVITLETSVSSQNAFIKRLRSESDELQGHLRGLEENKEALMEWSDSKSNKIRELEEELLRVQNLNQNVENRNRNLQIRFTQASFSIDHLCEKLLSVKQEVEEVQEIVMFKEKDLQVEEEPAFSNKKSKISKEKVCVLEPVEVRDDPNVYPERRFNQSEEAMAFGYHSNISNNERDDVSTKAEESFVQPNLSSCLDDHLVVPVEMRDVPNANAETKVKENQDAEKLRTEGEAKKYDNVSVKAEERFIQRELSFRLDDYFVEGPVDEVLSGHKEITAPACDEVIKKEKKNCSPGLRTVVIAEEENWFQFHPRDEHEDHTVNWQVKAVLGMDSRGFNDPVSSTVVVTEKGEEKFDNQDPRGSVRTEEGSIVHSSSTNPFDYFPERVFKEHECVVGAGNHSICSEDTKMEHKKNAEEGNIVHSGPSNPFDDSPERAFKEHGSVVGPGEDQIIPKDTKMVEKRTDKSLDYNHVRGRENFAQSSPSNHRNNVLGEFQMQGVPHANLEEELKEREDMVDPVNDSPISEDVSTKKEENLEKKDNVHYCSTYGKANENDNYIQLKSHENHIVGSQELEITEDEEQPNWQELFSNGLDDREKILLEQYNLVRRNYEEARKKLGEMENDNRESLFKFAVQIKELKDANDLKDGEIQSLHKKLNLWLNETPEISLKREGEEGEKRVISDQNQLSHLLDEQEVESRDRKGKEEGEKRVISVDEPHSVSMVEEKFRSDIDGLLEENIEFWLRFTTSFHQIQKFQTSVEDLQDELTKLRESKYQEGSSSKSRSAMNSSDVRPIYTHLREIQTELALWLEHNSLLEDDLQNRLSSLSSIHEEISRVSNAGSKEGEETLLSSYQAAKFQGEVLNMKQENNQVGYKLHEGLERVKELQSEIAKTLEDLEEEIGVKNKERKGSSSRSRIPLKSFLFGVRLRKQKPSSLFHCMSPALQKQYSDLGSLPP